MKVITEQGNKPIKAWIDTKEDGSPNIEDSALSQLKNLSRLPFIHTNGVAVMPDVHAGIGSTVGTVIATDKAVIPAAVGVDIGCLDKYTEFLTPSGWVKISEYTQGQEVLGFDIDTNEAKFDKPLAYVEKRNDVFYHLKSEKGLDQMLSSDHKILFYTGVKGRGHKPMVMLAEDFVSKHENLKKGIQGGFKSAFTTRGTACSLISDNWLRLRVMISADGCLRKGQRIEMHFKKERKITRCKELLKSVKIDYSEYKGADDTVFISFYNEALYTKDMSFVYKLSTSELKVVADESILWDGSECIVKGTTRKYYSSTIKVNADAIQFAFSGSGVRAGIYTQTYPGKGWLDCYYVIPTKNEYVGMRVGDVEQVPSEDGKAYCFTMPTGFFVARRNNNIFVTGNCGMNAVRLSLKAHQLPDNLSTIRSAIEGVVPLGKGGQTDMYASNGLKELPFSILTDLFKGDRVQAYKKYNSQVGTLGSGNHFIELCIDEEDYVWVMLHSGSRGIGNMIGSSFITKAKKNMEKFFISLPDADLAYFPEDTEDFNEYIEAVNWAQDYALENRKVMLKNVLKALHDNIPVEFVESMEAVNCHHNYVQKEKHFGRNLWVTRKGAVSAKKGELGIIPGSMGQKSYIVKGKGNLESYCSCSHGAGRVMSRTQAKKSFSLVDLIAQTKGVECRKDIDVLDEIPSAYKNLDVVMENQKDLIEVVHTLKAVLCIKGN